jgi:hypothetical protein
MYEAGILEAMIQVEAVRLALEKVPVDEITPKDVLEEGFYKIKNLDTGDISSTPLTYGKGDVEGVDEIRIDQVIDGKSVKVGLAPVHGIFTKE